MVEQVIKTEKQGAGVGLVAVRGTGCLQHLPRARGLLRTVTCRMDAARWCWGVWDAHGPGLGWGRSGAE